MGSTSVSKMSSSLPEKNVLVLYTGGTIGMTRNENGVLVPAPKMLEKKIRCFPQLHDQDYATKMNYQCLVLPVITDCCRILYTIKEYDPLLDSSDMSMKEWIQIANDLEDNYSKYDGFVVLHGTDTLIYTSSVLSFMLENLHKTVVVTGSQIPIFETRSDGPNNFAFALLFASGVYDIPEVTVFFGNRLYRGNRTLKVSATSFHAFSSPNIAPLASVGTDINVDNNNIFRPDNNNPFSAHTELNKNVGMIRFFPNITSEVVKAFLEPPVEGLIIESYGAGNIPSNRQDLLDALKEATDRGVIIVNCTQCIQGAVQDDYEASEILRDAGVTSGKDMTSEAAYAKLSYILSKNLSRADKIAIMGQNIRGELRT